MIQKIFFSLCFEGFSHFIINSQRGLKQNKPQTVTSVCDKQSSTSASLFLSVNSALVFQFTSKGADSIIYCAYLTILF